MLLLLLFNYPSARKWLGYHEVWIRASPFQIPTKELTLPNWLNIPFFSILFYFRYTPSSNWPQSWSHQQRNLLYTSLPPDRVQILNMRPPTMYSVIISCCILTYFCISHNPVTYRDMANGSNYHSPLSSCIPVSPASPWANLWWKPSSTTVIAYITTQLNVSVTNFMSNIYMFVPSKATMKLAYGNTVHAQGIGII